MSMLNLNSFLWLDSLSKSYLEGQYRHLLGGSKETCIKRFDGICIITQDVPRLSYFYRLILQVEAKGDNVFTAFSTNGAELSFFNAQGMEQMAPGFMMDAWHGGYTLEFEVEDVDQEYARLTRMNIPIVKPPTTQPWGCRSVWLRDPDGNIVNFYANVADSQRPEGVKAFVHQYFQRLLNEKDLSVCDEMLSNEYIDHDAPSAAPSGPQSTKEFVAGFLEEYPNLQVEIEDVLAEGSQVAARIVWHGNHRETGEVFQQMGIVILRINGEGKFVERWSAYKSIE